MDGYENSDGWEKSEPGLGSRNQGPVLGSKDQDEVRAPRTLFQVLRAWNHEPVLGPLNQD